MRRKVLFIDRDGTLIVEPKETCQVDAWEKLEFFPGAIQWLSRIAAETDFELVMVSNQDGLGTQTYPYTTFTPIHEHVLRTFANNGVCFAAVHIDTSFPSENKPTRKPQTGMLTAYFTEDYDLNNSFVIGDRFTDIRLAKNLGCGCIWLNAGATLVGNDEKETEDVVKENVVLTTLDWEKIYSFLKLPQRKVTVVRKTNETDILVNLNLDGSGKAEIHTGLGFFDHMLEQIAKHSLCDIVLHTQGDLHIDEHHTIEDTALAIGTALKEAIGDKRGIERYGFCLPMDDCEAHVSLDFSGRPWLVWDVQLQREKVGDMPTEMVMHFFKSLSDNALMNLNIKATGTNEHHKIESVFKAFARALKMAKQRDTTNFVLPSTKGVL